MDSHHRSGACPSPRTPDSETRRRRSRGAAPRLLCVLVLVLTAVGSAAAWAQDQGWPTRSLEMQARGGDLLAGLQRGGTVWVIAFGDSLTAGWGTDGRHVCHRIVTDTLRYSFPESRIEAVVQGHPGETTADALRRLREEVVLEGPDLLFVQFGGNDMGWGRPVSAFRRDFSRLLARAADETKALVIACLPPIDDGDPANEWSETAREVAWAAGVPVADLDRAIREGDADFRGPFPHGSHPGGFTHLIMAQEVLRAFREAVGIEPSVACRLSRGPGLSISDTFELEAEIVNLSDDGIDCAVRLECEGAVTDDVVSLEPGGAARLGKDVPVRAPDGHSYGFPVRLLARGGEGFGGVDVGWLTVAPAVRADTPPGDGALPGGPTWHHLAEDSLVLGRHYWLGPRDLSGRFAVVALADRICFAIEVTDNDVTTAGLEDPAQGDSVELYLDLRGDDDQGKPVYGRDVLALQIVPPTDGDAQALWRSMEPLPADLGELSIGGVRTEAGYTVLVELPLAPIIARRGEDWQGLGFDVGVNDADFGGTRRSQMMWAGTGDNYLNPAYLAGLYVDALPPGATRRTLQ